MNREKPTLVLLTLFALGCPTPGIETDDTDTESPTEEPEPLVWDDEAAAIDCSVGAVEAPLLDAVLLDAGLLAEEVGYSDTDWENASYGDYLDDPFRLSWFYDYLFEPLRFSCLGGQISADLDYATGTVHPVATAIGEAMVLVDATPVSDPLQPDLEPSELVDLSGLPEELREALGPILVALERAAEARLTPCRSRETKKRATAVTATKNQAIRSTTTRSTSRVRASVSSSSAAKSKCRAPTRSSGTTSGPKTAQRGRTRETQRGPNGSCTTLLSHSAIQSRWRHTTKIAITSASTQLTCARGPEVRSSNPTRRGAVGSSCQVWRAHTRPIKRI